MSDPLHLLGTRLVEVDRAVAAGRPHASRAVDGPAIRRRPRPAAVLALLSAGPAPDLVVTERAATLRHHAGQLSFPGGRIDPTDASAAAAALREAHEEIGLAPERVEVLGALPRTRLTTTAFDVVAVVGRWEGDASIGAVDPGEVAQVLRFGVAELADPEHRCSARHPGGGSGPCFVMGELMIWGFTAHLVDELLRLGGWERPWDRDRLVEIPRRFLRDGPPDR